MTIYFAVSHLGHLSAREVHQLYKLRTDIFVVEQNCAYEEIDEIDARPTTLHIRALENQELIGTARVYPDGANPSIVHLGRIAVHADHRRSGLGTSIVQQAIGLVKGQYPGANIAIDAQSVSVDFYRGLGFEVSGEEFDWDGIKHTPMLLTLT